LDYLEQKNYVLSVQHFRVAAERGIVSAQYNLGLRYALGQGVTQDGEQAAKWFRLAADQGHMKAQFWLASLYGSGSSGVAKDRQKALEFMKLAVQNGFSDASSAYEFGKAFAEGRDLPEPDYVLAYAWIIVAASKGLREAESMRSTVAGRVSSNDRTCVDNLFRGL